MPMPVVLPSFAAGELSPALHGRVDLAKYQVGLATCLNWFIHPFGGASTRAGTAIVGAVLDAAKRSKLVPFAFNTEQTYVLEFGDQKMRVIKEGGYVLEGALTIMGISRANPGVVTTSGAHGYSTGDRVFLDGNAGMTELNRRTVTLTVTGANSFSIGLDTSAYGAWTSGGTVARLTEPEIAQIRTTLENSPPEQQAKTMQALAQIPAEHIPGIATALAGKGARDPLSRSYAAALSFYADKDPASREIGNQILQGAKIIKDGGEGSRKPAVTSDAWQSQLQDRVGNLLRDADPRQMGVISDAVASVYVYQMNRAGRQGEKTDTDILNSAIKAVVGEPVVRNGQAILPPTRGMTAYDLDKALRSLSDGDLDGLRTLEGTPITAAVIQQRGILTNGRNGEGWYFVRIPDPRAGGDPRPVVNADGSLYQIDMRPLIERAARFPEGLAPLPDAVTRARGRAPVNPTEGLVP